MQCDLALAARGRVRIEFHSHANAREEPRSASSFSFQVRVHLSSRLFKFAPDAARPAGRFYSTLVSKRSESTAPENGPKKSGRASGASEVDFEGHGPASGASRARVSRNQPNILLS